MVLRTAVVVLNLNTFVIRVIRSLERAIGMERLVGNVAEETSDTARAPVGRVIKLRVRAGTHEAEVGVSLRIDDDAYMAAPDNQVACLRNAHACETRAANVEFARTDVLVGKARFFVNIVNKVGTVCFGFQLDVYRGNGGQNLPTLRSGDGTRSVCFRRRWPDILAERRRGRRQAQCCGYESTPHFVSLTGRGKSRTVHAAKTTPFGGTGPFFIARLETN